jgi:hypothetical protein
LDFSLAAAGGGKNMNNKAMTVGRDFFMAILLGMDRGR